MSKKYRLPPFASIIDGVRLKHIRKCCNETRCLEGGVAEVGVYYGGSLLVIANVFKDRQVYGIDTFAGHPDKCLEIDNHHKFGLYSDVMPYEELKEKFAQQAPNVVLLKGIFPEEIKLPDQNYVFVHVDCDIYNSVKDCCEYFYPRLVPSGIIVFDDYGHAGCDGAKLACDEYFSNRAGCTFTMLPTKVAVARKY